MIDWKEEERFDKYKTRVFKYVLYKPRTEKEIYYKFKNFEDSDIYLKKVIELLKELKYIDDKRYAEMYIEDSINIKRLSRFEIRNKLREKGISFLQSNSDCHEIRELYKDYEIKIVKAKRNINSKANKRGEINEVLIYYVPESK